MGQFSIAPIEDMITICAKFGIDLDEVEPLHGGITNTSNKVNGEYVVAILDGHDYRSAQSLAQLLRYLHGLGLHVPEILEPLNANEPVMYNGKYVMVKAYIDGEELNPYPIEKLKKLGAQVGKLHDIKIPDFPLPGNRRVAENWEACLKEYYCEDLKALIADAVADQCIWEGLTPGLIHGDIFPDNVLNNGDREWLIDWDDACIEPVVLDIALTFIGMCRTDNRLDGEKMREFLAGYQQERILTPEEMHALPAAVKYAAAVLAYKRFITYHEKYPEMGRKNFYKEMVLFAETIPNNFADLLIGPNVAFEIPFRPDVNASAPKTTT